MDRRNSLQVVASTLSAGLVSGCLGNTDLFDGSDTADRTNNESHTYEITPQTINGNERPVAYSATIIDGGIRDGDKPLTIELALTNTTDDELAFGERRWALFHGVSSDTEEFVLIPGTHTKTESETDGYAFQNNCWEETTTGAGRVGNGTYQSGNLAANETVTQSLLVLLRSGETCPDLSQLQISFSTELTVEKRSSVISNDADQTRHKWGFSLHT